MKGVFKPKCVFLWLMVTLIFVLYGGQKISFSAEDDSYAEQQLEEKIAAHQIKNDTDRESEKGYQKPTEDFEADGGIAPQTPTSLDADAEADRGSERPVGLLPDEDKNADRGSRPMNIEGPQEDVEADGTQN
ncbi:MAG: hypothetical protein HQL28_02925 [Candidatus Omnitrophica bacterium]|nr:hypothetical protein [Candidatus Omnitrophota bacterium]